MTVMSNVLALGCVSRRYRTEPPMYPKHQSVQHADFCDICITGIPVAPMRKMGVFVAML
jgi:hypothetical protein